MNNSEREFQNSPEQFEHRARASVEQLAVLYSQVHSLFELAQSPNTDMFKGTKVTFDPINQEAVYVLPLRERNDSTREVHIRHDGPGYIFDYRSQVDRLHAIRGMTIKADGVGSKSESAVYEDDHSWLFQQPTPVLLDQSHYDGVPQNYADVGQEYLDELWNVADTSSAAQLIA